MKCLGKNSAAPHQAEDAVIAYLFPFSPRKGAASLKTACPRTHRNVRQFSSFFLYIRFDFEVCRHSCDAPSVHRRSFWWKACVAFHPPGACTQARPPFAKRNGSSTTLASVSSRCYFRPSACTRTKFIDSVVCPRHVIGLSYTILAPRLCAGTYATASGCPPSICPCARPENVSN